MPRIAFASKAIQPDVRWTVGLVVAVALILRLLVFAYIASEPIRFYSGSGASVSYFRIGARIAILKSRRFAGSIVYRCRSINYHVHQPSFSQRPFSLFYWLLGWCVWFATGGVSSTDG
jgi:hypothetical protein